MKSGQETEHTVIATDCLQQTYQVRGSEFWKERIQFRETEWVRSQVVTNVLKIEPAVSLQVF